jgi:hypothetical protein
LADQLEIRPQGEHGGHACTKNRMIIRDDQADRVLHVAPLGRRLLLMAG